MAKKRANGEGNIRKRKDGRWEGRYTAGHDPETGKAIYKNVLGRTQAETRAKLKAAIEESKSLDVTKVGKYTVGAWMDEWFENYAKVKVMIFRWIETYYNPLRRNTANEDHLPPLVKRRRWLSAQAQVA